MNAGVFVNPGDSEEVVAVEVVADVESCEDDDVFVSRIAELERVMRQTSSTHMKEECKRGLRAVSDK